MKKIIKITQHNPQLMHLTWMINNICPNKCSYCPSDLHNGTNHNYDWSNAKRFFEILFDRYPTIHCSVSGGEASVSPFFPEIVKIFHTAGHTIGATSNAAKPVRYWNEIAPYLNYICFSYHPEFPDANFEEKVLAASTKTHVTVRIMMHPRYWDHCVEMYEKLDKHPNFFVEVVRIQDWGVADKTLWEYTEEQNQYFVKASRKEKFIPPIPEIKTAHINADYHMDNGSIDHRPNASDYVNNRMTNFNGYECEVGLKSLFISFDGRVYLGNCMINGPIGNINDPDNIAWPTKTTICSKNICHCSSDVNINKWVI